MTATGALLLDARTAAVELTRSHPGLRSVVGEVAWARLPAAVQARFAESATPVDYVGTFEIVRASPTGWLIAQLCRLLGTFVVPWVGERMAAVVRVETVAAGVAWHREYRRADGARCTVSSTKAVAADGSLVERLPAGLCMPLDVYERDGHLHFVSRGYYFDLGPQLGKLVLPRWLSPGTTHVTHADEGAGWFRFTMIVQHAWLGELYFQTGRFRAVGDDT